MQQPHFLVITVGSLGDLYPFLSLALTLQQRGYQVTLLGLSYHAPIIQKAGIPFIGIGTDEDYLARIREPNLWHPIKGFQVFLRDYRRHLVHAYHRFQDFACDQDYVVLAHPFALPSADLFRLNHPRTQVVAVHLAPASLRSCENPMQIGEMRIPHWLPMAMRKALWWLIDTLLIDPAAVPEINAARRDCGLPPIKRFMRYLLTMPDANILLFPKWFAAARRDWGDNVIQGGFPLFEPNVQQEMPSELRAFLAAGDAPIVFTPGTAHCHAAAYFRAALQAVQALGKRAIFLTQYPAQLPPDLPKTVHWQTYVPLRALLPSVAVVVHHGGIGTTAEALRAGIPQLVVPFAWDQFDNAIYIRTLGVGDSIYATRLNTDDLITKLQYLDTSAAVRERCHAVMEQFDQMPNMMQICHMLEEYLLKNRIKDNHE